MAKLNKKKVEEAVAVEEKELEVVDTKVEDNTSTKRLELAVGIVSRNFNLNSDYRVTKFNDKGKVVDITLEGDDFIISATIKDSDRQGMYVE